MGRSNKTISNELARCIANQYCAEDAERVSLSKRSVAHEYFKCNLSYSEVVKSALVLGFKAEQISGRMNTDKTQNLNSCGMIINLIQRSEVAEFVIL